jgi:hypothetical protein
MGTTASHPGRSAADQRYIELYKELHHHTSELVSDGEKPSDQTDQKVFKVSILVQLVTFSRSTESFY